MPLQPFRNQSYDLTTKDGSRRFQADIAQFLNGLLKQLQDGAFLGSILSGSGSMPNVLFSSVSANQTLNCNGAIAVMVRISLTAGLKLSLTNLNPGVPVWIAATNLAVSAQTFQIAATTPNSAIYTVTGFLTGTSFDFTATGISLSASQNRMISGNSTVGNTQLVLGVT